MKLRFERFEGLSVLSVRGRVGAVEAKLLQVGIENIVQDLDAPLVLNLEHASLDASVLPQFLELKKKLIAQTKFKIHWIAVGKGLTDFPSVKVFASRLTGFKHRQIGDRLALDDETYELNEEMKRLQEHSAKIGGDEARSHELILENQTLKEQERILLNTLRFQKARMKEQAHVPSLNEDLPEKIKLAREELKKIYGDTGV